MASGAGKLALVPLLAVAVALGATGVHGRRTHDPERAVRALASLLPTDDPLVARAELATFFSEGWVGWDIKTTIEIVCGTVGGRSVPNPLWCLPRAREIVFNHERREREVFGTYTSLAWGALVPGLLALAIAASELTEMARRKRRAA